MAAAFSPDVLTFLRQARVGHLATVDEQGRPSVVPVCFALEANRLYSAVDAKPKRLPPERLHRLRNLAANPRAALVVDHWDEDWARLGWVLLRGEGKMVTLREERARALALLRDKYAQYRAMDLETAPLIRITVAEHQTWGDLGFPQFSGA